MSIAKRQKQILDFVNSAEYKELDAFYSQSSLFSALGVSRHENTHSNFIAWLLTPRPEKNNHGLGDMPLRKLLETLALVCGSLPHSLGKLPPNVSNAIISGGYSLSDITVEREKHIQVAWPSSSPKGERPGGAGRLDIFVEGTITFDDKSQPFRLAVENKIKSSEHDSQTVRYQEALNASVSRPGIYLGVYLTPLSNREYEALDAPQCGARDFIQLNYQYLADRVITPCRDFAIEGSVKRYLDEYLLALGLPELRQDKGDIIMAISKEERDLLARFWDKHKDLLIAAMLSMADSDALDESEYETVKNASDALKIAVQRDMTRYSWGFQGESGERNLPKNRLALEIVRHYVGKRQHITLGALKGVFPDSLQSGRLNAIELLENAGPENFGGHKRYYHDEPISLDDAVIAVSNQWSTGNIAKFIAIAEKQGYSISSTGPEGSS